MAFFVQTYVLFLWCWYSHAFSVEDTKANASVLSIVGIGKVGVLTDTTYADTTETFSKPVYSNGAVLNEDANRNRRKLL